MGRRSHCLVRKISSWEKQSVCRKGRLVMAEGLLAAVHMLVSFLSPVGMHSVRMAPGASWRVVCWKLRLQSLHSG